ncbi:MAG: tRNA (adenosine(37)-N6)-dimethylallyltransferase MiaA [Cyanobacteria bacterium]|nr:tRNA (adenosine(37)-N6)-dimethylallyltransferase MiaA [Cyanobacteria bacterium CG_2015-16_32_12]NCO77821.1 tRNA (adenosine(37)-N6)-dimethylallyltransferase MiaA [Cyanobacteria bacterium CG_2015-22_32_23]NCQ05014.1 tRNA (adenosine(37)-N6)-dimethylallyltransferase MiaA [Cyanobacteria bacterium CG_2015-09_32_10]NCQ43104.1 tRNA (adenosine(37)-N6)-dimethylallyltransferase MiaA [Cyanobacteria bacterium CG_2015-04_32_10]NCS86192.1 tRNA (adenosine(37)-N6)-dimethylallyltransferase MiaA [Cyanobacteria
MKKGLIVICGATASGKSSLGLKLAQRLNTIIISGDSRQVYQEFDIGTAKPSLQEQTLVPHYLIDICHPTETLTLADYQEKAQTIINSFPSIPLLVGGTGLYLDSITKGLKIPKVSPQPELRRQLEYYSQQERYSFLQQIDSKSCEKIHHNDEFRTIRALEVYYVTGKPISEQQGENPPSYPILHIGLHCDKDAIYQRIEQRTQIMIKMGLVEETENLINKYGADLPLLNTLGYAEIKQYITGEISLTQAEELIVIHTRQFAKRQRTWFNGNKNITWFNANSPDLLEQVWNVVKNQFTLVQDNVIN